MKYTIPFFINYRLFTTIFTLSIKDVEDLNPQTSGILYTMIVGSAIIPPFYDFCTDLAGFKMAFLLLLACFGYIYYFAKTTSKN